ncbi:uncharacterized protein ACIB01_008979 [Guaruba guarouba]
MPLGPLILRVTLLELLVRSYPASLSNKQQLSCSLCLPTQEVVQASKGHGDHEEGSLTSEGTPDNWQDTIAENRRGNEVVKSCLQEIESSQSLQLKIAGFFVAEVVHFKCALVIF